MNIEIMEFYPIHRDNKRYTGTIRLRLVDIGIQILGIHVIRTKERWYFNIPFKTGTDELGNLVQYPVLSFEDKEFQRDLIRSIQEKAPAFIEARIIDPLKPVVFKLREKKYEHKKQLPKKEEIKHNCANDYKQNTQSKILKWTKADGLKKR
mgnify:CR=1 FL=1